MIASGRDLTLCEPLLARANNQNYDNDDKDDNDYDDDNDYNGDGDDNYLDNAAIIKESTSLST